MALMGTHEAEIYPTQQSGSLRGVCGMRLSRSPLCDTIAAGDGSVSTKCPTLG